MSMSSLNAGELINAGKFSEALSALKKEIKDDSNSADLRFFLFQAFAVNGEWERARTQLNLCCSFDKNYDMIGKILTKLLDAEVTREKVFAGKESPLLFGAPNDWLVLLIQALKADAEGKADLAEELRGQAFDKAETNPGVANEEAFQWFGDMDPRLGPVMEVIVDGKYYWCPMENIKSMVIERPSDLKDIVWTGCHFTWINGGTAAGFIPTRYAGSTSVDNDLIKLSRLSDWIVKDGVELPVGPREFVSDVNDFPLLGLDKIVFDKELMTPEPESEPE